MFFAGALTAINGGSNVEGKTTSELTIDGIKYITKNIDVVSDLNSAVYMFLFVQTLARHIEARDAYHCYVCKLNFQFSTWIQQLFDCFIFQFLCVVNFCKRNGIRSMEEKCMEQNSIHY